MAKSVHPEMNTGNQQEQAECNHIHQSEDKGGHITAAAEQLVRNDTGKHRTHNATDRTDGNDETGIQCRIALLRFQIEYAPTVHRITADIHKSTTECQYPDGRIAKYGFLRTAEFLAFQHTHFSSP